MVILALMVDQSLVQSELGRETEVPSNLFFVRTDILKKFFSLPIFGCVIFDKRRQ